MAGSPVARSSTETTDETVARIEQVLAVVERLPGHGADEAAAVLWLTGQRDWLKSDPSEEPETTLWSQVIHGDYHETNLVFRGDSVAGVLDWDRTRTGCPLEEVIRAMHLSFRLDPASSRAFLGGYRRERTVTMGDLDAAANRYGFQRDRSVWFFDELYRLGNERLRRLVNNGPFVSFKLSWGELRRNL